MLDFMDYVQRAFERGSGWNRENSYENITATSDSLINFAVPTSFKFQTADRPSNNMFNTMEITAHKRISGSIAYLYTDVDGMNELLEGSQTRTLQEATETYRHIQPHFLKQQSQPQSALQLRRYNRFKPKSLYYGRMFYPSSILEAMIVKRWSPYHQLTVKSLSSINSPLNVILVNWQRYRDDNFQEVTFSSEGALCGYRFLHNVVSSPSKFNNSLYNNSSLAVGGEIWLGLSTLTPGCSTSLRYCTHAATTGRPLTLTFSWNPLFGHISSTYSAKTSMNSTFSAKYDFNLYSTDSNLSFGCEFWRKSFRTGEDGSVVEDEKTSTDAVHPSAFLDMEKLPHATNEGHAPIPEQQQRLLDDVTHTFSSSLEKIDKEKAIIDEFETSFNTEPFSNVWKLATSLRDKNLRILWEGKFKGFLLSAGTEVFLTREYMNSVLQSINQDESAKVAAQETSAGSSTPINFGLTIQYSS
ncbi:Mdm10 protein [Maudiozyma humilis]|uniref:Mitochondrial distribution and morphology protein 10 n=1 Tax=Maudiozyma humilis TaxID=51915 RepID=A0AAV5RW20_MAUHU|nr:Mdm10 protein [Kazachstania humilis]